MKTRKKIGVVLFVTAFMVLFTVACNSDTKSKDEEKNSTEVSKPDITTIAKKKRTGKALMKMKLEDNNNLPATKREVDKSGVYSSADVMPAYPGGSDALSNYILNNIEYPSDALDNSIEGTVMVEFVVDEKGNISNVHAINEKIGYGLEEEAVNVVSKTSGWSPAKIKNKNVKMKMRIPITYTLS